MESHIAVAGPEQLRGTVSGLAAAPAKNYAVCAVSSDTGSRLLRVGPAEPISLHVIADASRVGDDSWFHGPMAVSPDGGWLLVTVSPERAAALAKFGGEGARDLSYWSTVPGDLWLVDCAQHMPPRRLTAGCRLLSCVWDPSARYAACEIAASDGKQAIILVDAERAKVRTLTEGRGRPVWSLMSPGLQIVRAQNGRSEALICNLDTGATVTEAVLYPWSHCPADATWSYYGEVAAWVEPMPKGPMIRIANRSGVGRGVSVPSGSAHLLCWSGNAGMVAYLQDDGTLHFSLGVVSADGRARLLAVLPRNNPPEIPGELADYFMPQTSVSPVRLLMDRPLLTAWVSGEEGPCFLYAQSAPGTSQVINALAFKTLSLKRDFKVDLGGNPREDVIRGGGVSQLVLFCAGLARYANDHNGLLPPHAEGAALVEDMTGYCSPYLFTSPYADDSSPKLRLLRPGANLGALEEEKSSRPEAKLAIAELLSDDGWVFVANLEWIAKKYDDTGSLVYDCIIPSIEAIGGGRIEVIGDRRKGGASAGE